MKKDYTISFRVTPEEYEKLKNRAEKKYYTLSMLIRFILFPVNKK